MATTALIIAGVAAAAGAGIGMSASKDAKSGPAPRGVGNELDSLPYGLQRQTAQDYVDQQMGNEQKYAQMVLGLQPWFAGQTREDQIRSAKAGLSVYPEFAAAERGATRAQRKADLKDLTTFGPGLQAAFAASNPGYAKLFEEIGNGPYDSVLLSKLNTAAIGADRQPIAYKLEQQALDELNLGRSLSAEEERDASQSARAAWAARGLGSSTGAVADEVLNRDQFARQREAQRRQFAAGVMGLVANEDERNRAFGINVEGLNQNARQQRRGFLLGATELMNRPLESMLRSRAADSFSPVLGAMGLAPSTGMTSSVMQQSPSLFQGVQALTPLYDYGADVFNTNFNARESRVIRAANGKAAVGAGLMSFAGSVGGAAVGGGGGMGAGGGGMM